MIDFAKITVRAGDGGSGSGSFVHIKGKRRGKADGGNGGSGGNIYLEATNDLNTLEPFRFVKEYTAENGENGLSNKRKGAEGRDYVVRVPVGTVVEVLGPVTTFPPVSAQSSLSHVTVGPSELGSLRAVGSPSSSATHSVFYDLSEDGQRVLFARGGEGGKGNCHLKDEYGRRPFKGEVGEKGEFCELVLELKLIAQVGLIGLPNAGKSTLLAKLTSAKPKIAPYPFTTLEPNLGVMYSKQRPEARDQRMIIADIPGLIEGASQGKGLGDLFLRHIERTSVLVHLIDASGGGDVFGNYQVVRRELSDYSKELAKKREIIAVNKIDLVSIQVMDQIKSAFSAKRKKIYLISAETGEGIDELVKAIAKKL